MATQERAAGDWKDGARAYDPNGDSSAIVAEARDVAVPDPQVLALRDMAGQSLVRSQTSYITAMRVTKERDLEEVRKKLVREATFGQDGWYYSWTQAGQPIEGGTIGLAERVLSLYGNMVANAEVKSWMGNRVLFHAVAIDLESGATFESDYLATMAPAPAKYAKDATNKERWYQMQFQSHKSRALRDVIFRLAPRWLVDLAVAEAKAVVEANIKAEDVITAREAALKLLKQQYGVDKERVLAALEVPTVGVIGAKEVATLRGFYSALKNGERTVEEIFGVDEGAPAPKKEPPKTAEYQPPPEQLAGAAQEAQGTAQAATPATGPVEPEKAATPSPEPLAARAPEQPILEAHLKALAIVWAPHLAIKPHEAEVLLRSRNLSVQAGIELVTLARAGKFDLKRFGELTGIPLNI